MEGVTDKWFDNEIAACEFADERLGKRLRKLLERMGGLMGESTRPPLSTSRVEIIARNGCRLIVDASLDGGVIARLLDVVERR